jgi:hypothetical protein
MDCNCSVPNCWSKIPKTAVVSYHHETKLPYKIRIQEKNWTVGPIIKYRRTVFLTLDDWKILCEDMMCTDDGTVWEAYVPDKK